MAQAPNVFAEVQSISDHHKGKKVTVDVTGPKVGSMLELDSPRALRARARALAAVGPRNAVNRSLENMKMRKVERLTSVSGVPKQVDSSRATQTNRYKVIVKT